MPVFRSLAVVMCLCSFSAAALNVGSVTTIIADNQSLLGKEINNETDAARLVTVKIERITSPFSSATVLPFDRPDELLVTPSQIMMPADTKNIVKFYYQGKADDIERYYQVTFTDEAINDIDAQRSAKQANAMTRVVISTILVVQPRNKNFDFRFKNNKISNTGNVSWRVTAMGRCLKPGTGRETCRDVFYVPPGKTYGFPDVDISDARTFIGIWDIDRYVPVNKSESPQ